MSDFKKDDLINSALIDTSQVISIALPPWDKNSDEHKRRQYLVTKGYAYWNFEDRGDIVIDIVKALSDLLGYSKMAPRGMSDDRG
jgi:hypothetical protein